MENNPQYIKAARKIFKNYNFIQMKIKQLEESIETAKKNVEISVNCDIYSASVSHGSEGSIGNAPNSSADKIPQIVENIDKIRSQYDEQVYVMQYQKNILESAVNSIKIYVSSLDWEDKTLINRHYLDNIRKSYDEISTEIHISSEGLRKRERKLMKQYAKSVNIDILEVAGLIN